MYYRNATDLKIANLEARLTKLEKKAFFDMFKSSEDIVKDEMLKLHPKMKQMTGFAEGSNFYLTIPNSNPITLEKEHTWFFITEAYEKDGTAFISILISPFKGKGTREQMLYLPKNLFYWKDQCPNNRASIKESLEDFLRYFQQNHKKMVQWGIEKRIISAEGW